MRVGQANIRSLSAIADLIDIACSKQKLEIMCMSKILHPDNTITNKIKKRLLSIASERN